MWKHAEQLKLWIVLMGLLLIYSVYYKRNTETQKKIIVSQRININQLIAPGDFHSTQAKLELRQSEIFSHIYIHFQHKTVSGKLFITLTFNFQGSPISLISQLCFPLQSLLSLWKVIWTNLFAFCFNLSWTLDLDQKRWWTQR